MLATAIASVAVSVGVLPATAVAASFTVGARGGDAPAVAVDSAGSAHVVWKDDGASPSVVPNTPLDVCNIPAAATRCGSTASLLAPTTGQTGTAFDFSTISNATYGSPAIFSEGTALYVVSTYTIEGISPSNNQDSLELEWTSTDGGATWTNPAPIGTFDNTENASVNGGESIIADPTDNIFVNGPWGRPGGPFGAYNVQANTGASVFPATDVGSDPPGLQTNQTGTAGSPPQESDVTPFAALTLNPPATPGNGSGTLTSSIGQGGGSIVGVWDNAQNGFNFNYAYLKSDVPTTAANINNSANWVTTHMPAGVNLGDASLTSGATGPFLLENAKSYPALSRWYQPKETFTPETEVDCGDVATSGAGMQSENLTEDPNGLLHLVYSTSTNFVGTLKYSDIAGTLNGFVQNYPLTLDSHGEYHEPRISVNADSQGIVVWDDPAMTGTPIRAVWLPSPLPARTTLPDCKTPPLSAKKTVSGLHLTVTTPAACHALLSKVPFTISASGKLTKGTKVSKLEFFVGKGLKRTQGTGKHKHAVYLPNLTSPKLLGSHTVRTGGKGETTVVTKNGKITVRVVAVVTTAKRRRIVRTQTFTISIPFNICEHGS